MNWIGDLILGILGGGSLVTLIIFLIKRKDSHNEELNAIKEYIEDSKKWRKKMEKDVVRTQLLILMTSYSDADEAELLTCAEHYFKTLKGDWYLTSMFSRFIEEHGIKCPIWFEG